jgi:hypothetical protein
MEYIRLASNVMKPKLVAHPQHQHPEELLEDFEEFMSQVENEEQKEFEFEDNVIPFPDPKDTLH